MAEVEHKLCLVEPTLEKMENGLLQVQMQLMGAMEDGEALEAAAEVEVMVDMVIILHQVLLHQQQMEAMAEQEVMEAVAEEEVLGDGLLKTLQEQEVQEVLAVLEEAAEAAEMRGFSHLKVEEIMVVMVQQEAMAEEGEKEGVLVIKEVLVAAVAVALD